MHQRGCFHAEGGREQVGAADWRGRYVQACLQKLLLSGELQGAEKAGDIAEPQEADKDRVGSQLKTVFVFRLLTVFIHEYS